MARILIDTMIPNIPLLQGTSAIREALLFENRRYAVRVTERIAARGRQETPVGATALLKGTIVTDLQTGIGQPANVTGRVIWQQPYGIFVAKGTAPHTPPIAPLLRWAERVLGNRSAAYAVQRSIARRGTRANPFDERALAAVRPELLPLYNDAINRFVRTITGS